MKLTKALYLLLLCVLVGMAFAATAVAAGGSSQATAFVAVSDFMFAPNAVTINVGDSVQWDNMGGLHNVVADDNSFTSGAPSSEPWSFTQPFPLPGTYNYYCAVHGAPGGVGMSGQVLVQGDARFRARLSGANELPPVQTDATALAALRYSGGSSMTLFMRISNIANATMGHIHCAPAGSNGPVGVTIFTGMNFSGDRTVLRSITGPDAGNACGWASLNDVVGAMATGNAYINVHTMGHPSGEIRGQLALVNGQ